jgi:pilus assembly protein CpaC
MVALRSFIASGWKWQSPVLLALSVAGSYIVWVSKADAQAIPPKEQPACCIQSGLPPVPLKEQRPAQGTGPGETWQVARQGRDRTPTASFIDSLRANDAAIEVVIGQGRLMTLKTDIASRSGTAVVAVGDPTVLEFQLLPNPRMIRLIGQRTGVTDLSIVAADGQTYSYEVHVVFDLEMLRAHLRQAFPDTEIRLAQLRSQVVVEGEARSPTQVSQIVDMIKGDLAAAEPPRDENQQAPSSMGAPLGPGNVPPPPAPGDAQGGAGPQPILSPQGEVGRELHSDTTSRSIKYPRPQLINLLRVPGVHQVMLQVRIAELNRTAIRQIGADFLGFDPKSGSIFGTSLGNGTVDTLGTLSGTAGLASLVGKATAATSSGAATTGLSSPATAFGIFPSANFAIMIHALRENSLLSILAEPNLVAMSGQQASFLAGGQFPVPVPQSGGTAGAPLVTIQWQKFGVQLDFVPYVLEDETIRLKVTPDVSSIDFAVGTSILGTQVPGLNERSATTTVELRQGETLAIAGLLSVTMAGDTKRIPGLGDVPYLGPLFSNTSHERQEKELLVLVTPHLVAPMNCDQVPPLPNADLKDPTDLEFYLKNRIEGRKDPNYRSTANWDESLQCRRVIRLEKNCVNGPVGFSQ